MRRDRHMLAQCLYSKPWILELELAAAKCESAHVSKDAVLKRNEVSKWISWRHPSHAGRPGAACAFPAAQQPLLIPLGLGYSSHRDHRRHVCSRRHPSTHRGIARQASSVASFGSSCGYDIEHDRGYGHPRTQQPFIGVTVSTYVTPYLKCM